MDKREAVRVPVQVRARCRDARDVVIDGLVEDLSRSGLFLRTALAFDEGTTAELALELPGETPLELAVEVVRIEHSERREGMGLRFVGAPRLSRALANFIMRQYQTSR